jgi:hypothetical protein
MRGYTSTNKRFLSLTFYHVDAVGALHRHCLGKALFGSRCAATQHSLLDNGKGEKKKRVSGVHVFINLSFPSPSLLPAFFLILSFLIFISTGRITHQSLCNDVHQSRTW